MVRVCFCVCVCMSVHGSLCVCARVFVCKCSDLAVSQPCHMDSKRNPTQELCGKAPLKNQFSSATKHSLPCLWVTNKFLTKSGHPLFFYHPLLRDFKKTCYIGNEVQKTQAETLVVSVEANFVSVGCEGLNLCCALPPCCTWRLWWFAEARIQTRHARNH